jgi:hypothetical protein
MKCVVLCWLCSFVMLEGRGSSCGFDCEQVNVLEGKEAVLVMDLMAYGHLG